MIAEAGLIALWLAATLALLQFIVSFFYVRTDQASLLKIISPIAVVQGMLCIVSFTMLTLLFLDTDLSVLLVAQNSHIDKPWLFKFAGTWGNHEGSMLLWVTVLALCGGAIAVFEKRLDQKTFAATLMVQAFVSFGFYAFLLFSSNPFERLTPAPVEGAGLNPLLQDIGLAFHPPTLYIGYVGLSIAFSVAVGGLISGKINSALARAMRPWALLSWIFLTLGISGGSYWAYYELGWGGWWFWDPVENASLMPWIAATALLHSIAVMATRDALRSWTIILALVGFAMSMAGTFLVRSGILTSVHAFAVDPERGAFILALMVINVAGALLLYALRINQVRQGKIFNLFSREGAIIANNILLVSILAVVFMGTLFPLFAEGFADKKISVGPPYFNKASVPFIFLLMILLLIGPLLRWRKDDLARVGKKILISAFVGTGMLVILVILVPDVPIFSTIAIALSAALAIGSFMPLKGRNLMRTPLTIYGMVIAHFGIAVTAFGMAAESGFSSQLLKSVEIGDEHQIAGWKVKLNNVVPVIGDNWVATQAELEIRKEGDRTKEFEIMRPEQRLFFRPEQETSEAALLTKWNGQLYAVLGTQNDDGRWQLRVWWKPFVTFIWYGSIIIAFGGILSLVGRGKRRKKKAEVGSPWQKD